MCFALLGTQHWARLIHRLRRAVCWSIREYDWPVQGGRSSTGWQTLVRKRLLGDRNELDLWTRYRANGQLDSTFGVGGTAATTPDINAPHVANAVTIQSDGKILVAGYCGNGTNVDFCLLRYHSDGTNDVNFGTSGKVLTAIGVGQDYANVVALQPDGKILLAGHCNNGSTDAFCALRYDGGPFGYRNCSSTLMEQRAKRYSRRFDFDSRNAWDEWKRGNQWHSFPCSRRTQNVV
jgi:uncharacterized delta-60 repeat protein